MELQEAYKQKMSAHMQEWSAQINLLEAKLKTVAADVRVKRAEEIQVLRAKQVSAATKLKEMENSSGEAWDLVKDTADKMWADLKTGVTEAQAKFK
jgi:hypothetical protein